MRRKVVLLMGAVALCLMQQPANAGIMSFFGVDSSPFGTVPAGGNAATARGNFLAGLTGVGTEDFEGIALGTSNSTPLTFPGTTGNITATLTSTSSFEVRSTNSAGAYPTSGTRYLRTSTSTDPNEFAINFDSPIAAFGFYGTDLGDSGGGDVVLTLTNGTTETLTVPVGNNTTTFQSDNLIFFGFISDTDSYSSIAFGNNGGTGDVWGFDDMTIGDIGQVIDPNNGAVPEPTSLAIFATLGLVGVGVVGARRRKKDMATS
ncbi:hypothetical protein Poly51_32480 [Rubripirellula tenax]|uniref:PEP-CTERM motif protein n=1 Tax=Rubripirellula tenax TaxID=2528015 RepID=A0A5C6F407_9BACT|nr:PEP-CTERM sorting domain-containing protein [Rubripirellula tenax]TWU54529.1 hypothetical protein Poly51_32480 [Rubripirellula tenax]